MEVYDLIIIGGGPAGITAGIYGARKTLKTLLITKDFVGQIGKTGSVENYPGLVDISGPDLISAFHKHLEKFEVSILKDDQVKSLVKNNDVFELETAQGKKLQGKAVIVASGRNQRPLKVPGEEQFSGKGISYCSTCDAPLFRNKAVAVVGGGNAGFEAAIDLLNYATKVYLLEFAPKPLADELLQNKFSSSDKSEVIVKAKTIEIKGKEMVEMLVYEDMESGQKKELAVQGIFIQIGSLPATEFLKELVDFNKAGE
ncbi:MAG: FAD-dependent oxidoreductase, partial [bacterium]|nr:FAD-dependent oxidoreductase [bacterium]